MCEKEVIEMAEPFTTYKLIVLYMAKHSKETLTNSQISEFILDRDYTDYFQLQKVLSELVESEQFPTVPIMRLRKREKRHFLILQKNCRVRLRTK